MKIYRKVIPKIARDILRTLLQGLAIEVEEGHRDDAERDIARVLVKYLDEVDKLNNDAQEALTRQGLPMEHLGKVKKILAETRQLVLGEHALEYVLDQIIDALFQSHNVEEVFAEDHELRRMLQDSVNKYLGVDEELDREVRGRLKNFREGTVEWESEYGRLIGQMRLSRS